MLEIENCILWLFLRVIDDEVLGLVGVRLLIINDVGICECFEILFNVVMSIVEIFGFCYGDFEVIQEEIKKVLDMFVKLSYMEINFVVCCVFFVYIYFCLECYINLVLVFEFC